MLGNSRQIEQKAKELRRRIWEQREKLWPDEEVHDSIRVLDPEVAATALGLRYEFSDDLGRFGSRGDRHEVAGCLNLAERRVLISRRFNYEVQRFTGAHEVAHCVLHRQMALMIMHRDRPRTGLQHGLQYRSPVEQEADRFAAAFLVPPAFLRKVFFERFHTDQFEFDENTAFQLSPQNYGSLVRAEQGSLTRALALATATHYGGAYFDSLANLFGVSVTTMALRLRELGLVKEWP